MMEKYFEEIHDPRQQAKVQHKLSEIIVLVICAVISGCDVWEDIADFCRVKLEWFRAALGLELRNGIPSHDTMERVFEMMDPKEFEQSFAQWIEDTCMLLSFFLCSLLPLLGAIFRFFPLVKQVCIRMPSSHEPAPPLVPSPV